MPVVRPFAKVWSEWSPRIRVAPVPIRRLCGHIHESRGTIRHSFGQHNNDNKGSITHHQYHDGGDRETLVVNAANANCGIAKRLNHGPAVLQLTMEVTGGKSRNNTCRNPVHVQSI